MTFISQKLDFHRDVPRYLFAVSSNNFSLLGRKDRLPLMFLQLQQTQNSLLQKRQCRQGLTEPVCHSISFFCWFIFLLRNMKHLYTWTMYRWQSLRVVLCNKSPNNWAQCLLSGEPISFASRMNGELLPSSRQKVVKLSSLCWHDKNISHLSYLSSVKNKIKKLLPSSFK